MTTIAPPPATAIRPATQADTASLARTLAAAFRDDPVVGWMFTDLDRLPAAYAMSLSRMWTPHGAVLTTEDGSGVACWVPPHAVHPTAVDQLRMLPAMARVVGRGLPRVLSGLAALDAGHPHEPHWYLPKLAVDPAVQGRGIGSRLLEHMTERLDEDGMPAYLSATTERNRRLYERHGFVVTAEGRMPKGGPPFWRMWRSAAAVATA